MTLRETLMDVLVHLTRSWWVPSAAFISIVSIKKLNIVMLIYCWMFTNIAMAVSKPREEPRHPGFKRR